MPKVTELTIKVVLDPVEDVDDAVVVELLKENVEFLSAAVVGRVVREATPAEQEAIAALDDADDEMPLDEEDDDL